MFISFIFSFFFFNDTATTEIYTLSLHDALPISVAGNGSYRTPDTRVDRFAGCSVDPGNVAHGVLVHLRDPGQDRAAREGPAAGSRPHQYHSPATPSGRHRNAWTQRQQHGLDLSICPRRSSANARPA